MSDEEKKRGQWERLVVCVFASWRLMDQHVRLYSKVAGEYLRQYECTDSELAHVACLSMNLTINSIEKVLRGDTWHNLYLNCKCHRVEDIKDRMDVLTKLTPILIDLREEIAQEVSRQRGAVEPLWIARCIGLNDEDNVYDYFIYLGTVGYKCDKFTRHSIKLAVKQLLGEDNDETEYLRPIKQEILRYAFKRENNPLKNIFDGFGMKKYFRMN